MTWSFGDDEKALGDYAWCHENIHDIGEEYAHQVGLKKPNAFGLHDMYGNVYEWCHDYFEEDYYKQSPEKDPTGPTSGSFPSHAIVPIEKSRQQPHGRALPSGKCLARCHQRPVRQSRQLSVHRSKKHSFDERLPADCRR